MILLIISFLLSILNIFFSKYFFELNKCVINKGVAFGISIEYVFVISIFLLISLIVLGSIKKGGTKYILFSIFLFGLSNFITRLLLGGICDYLSIYSLAFNIADFGIVVLSIWLATEISTSDS
jgi:lipoprotein signal peptidase